MKYIYTNNIMGVRRRYNQNMGIYQDYDTLNEAHIKYYGPSTEAGIEGSGSFYVIQI